MKHVIEKIIYKNVTYCRVNMEDDDHPIVFLSATLEKLIYVPVIGVMPNEWCEGNILIPECELTYIDLEGNAVSVPSLSRLSDTP